MFADEARTFLNKPLVARISVIDPDGFPHTVPVWFMLDGDDIVVISVRDTKKVGYIAANAKGCAVIGGGPDDGGGYLLKGHWSIEPDPDRAWTKKITYHYEEPEQAAKDVADWTDLDMIVLRLKPTRVIKVA